MQNTQRRDQYESNTSHTRQQSCAAVNTQVRGTETRAQTCTLAIDWSAKSVGKFPLLFFVVCPVSASPAIRCGHALPDMSGCALRNCAPVFPSSILYHSAGLQDGRSHPLYINYPPHPLYTQHDQYAGDAESSFYPFAFRFFLTFSYNWRPTTLLAHVFINLTPLFKIHVTKKKKLKDKNNERIYILYI